MSGEKRRALLVGELNPYGVDPYFALYPEPRGATGDRLCTLVMELRRGQYIKAFDRTNLCEGKWSLPAARQAAERILQDTAHYPRPVVLLGSKVASAFGCPFEPFTIDTIVMRSLLHMASAAPPEAPLPVNTFTVSVVLLPHPSGLNRMWQEPGAFERARGILREAGVLPVAVPVAEEREADRW